MDPRLKGLAYRMLGSVSDAEDVVQEAHLRLHQATRKPDSEEAFLYRVVSNLCVDRLRRLKTERKHYFGPWLPDPVSDDDIDPVEQGEDLRMAFMLMLESLSPAERVVYVLREAYDFSFAEIGNLLDISVNNARQRARRARVRLAGTGPQPVTPREEQRDMLEAMITCMSNGDLQGLSSLLTDDAVALTDGGGVVSAAITPIFGAERIAQVSIHLGRKAEAEAPLEFRSVPLNNGYGVLALQDGEPHSCFQVECRDGKVERIYVMRHPDKLAHLAPT